MGLDDAIEKMVEKSKESLKVSNEEREAQAELEKDRMKKYSDKKNEDREKRILPLGDL